MKVKIVKSSYNKYWYSNKIGEKFEVFKGQWYPDSYTLLNKQIFHINVKDCIIIEEEEMKKNCIIIDGKEIKLSDETVKEIKEKLSIKKKETLQWIPEEKEEVWIINGGEIYEVAWSDCFIDRDYFLLTGNIYKTQEIAQRKLNDINNKINQTFIKIENYVRNNNDGWRAKWDNYQLKHFISYNDDGGIWVVKNTLWDRNNFTYMSESMARKIVEILNESGEL